MERMILLKYLKSQLDTNLKIILLDHQNNYVERLSNAVKSVGQNVINLSVLYNYFGGPTKLFSNLGKFLDTS